MVRQAELEAFVRRVLVRTDPFKRVELIRSNINWLTEPPEARLDVFLTGTLTPNQVGLLEDFVAQEIGQSFTLIFQIGQIEEIRRGSDEQSPTATE